MYFVKQVIVFFIVGIISFQLLSQVKNKKAIKSIDVNYTITNVEIASNKQDKFIVANSYEGSLLGVSIDGTILWKNPISGFMNHDIYIRDINNDDVDEILVANADGNLYCLNASGELQWKFKKNEAPLYALSAIKKDEKIYVVVGGFDNNIYYLNPEGKLIKTIASNTYSIEKPW